MRPYVSIVSVGILVVLPYAPAVTPVAARPRATLPVEALAVN